MSGSIAVAGSSIVITWLAPRFPHGGGAPSPTRMVMTGNGGTSSGHGVRQSLTMTSRSIGAVLPLDERAQPDAHVGAAAAIQLDLRVP